MPQITSYSQVTPSQEVKNILKSYGYEHTPSQCHYSAKALTLIDESAEYYSGFVVRNITPYRIVAHSFNLINGSVVDLARMTEGMKPMEIIETTGMPHTYYGIKIPKDFIKKCEEGRSMKNVR